MSDHHVHTPTGGESRGHETSDVGVRPFVWVVVGLAVAAVLGNLVLFGFYNTLSNRIIARQEQPGPMARATQLPPEPRLEISPERNWQATLAEHTQQLNSYGWVDQNAGTARIPIERAMQLTLERGLPTRAGATTLEESPDLQQADDLDSEGGQPPENDARDQPGAEE